MKIIKVCFNDAVLEGKYMWFYDNNIEAVCKMQLDTFQVTVVASFRSKKNFCGRKIFAIRGKYYITERGTASLLAYGEATDEKNLFHLYRPFKEYNNMDYETYRLKNRIYFIPLMIDRKVLCFDVDMKRYFYNSFGEQILCKMEGMRERQFGRMCLYGNEVWIPICGTKYYIKYNLEKEKSDLFEVEDVNAAMLGIYFDGKDIWMTLQDERNVICDEKKRIKFPLEQTHAKTYHTNNFIILPYVHKNKLTLIYKKNYKAIVIDVPSVDAEAKDCESWNIGGCCEMDTHIFLFPYGKRDLYVLDKKKLKIDCIKLTCDNYVEYYLNHRKEATNEDKDIDVIDYLQFLKGSTVNLENEKLHQGIGKIIWHNIRQ